MRKKILLTVAAIMGIASVLALDVAGVWATWTSPHVSSAGAVALTGAIVGVNAVCLVILTLDPAGQPQPEDGRPEIW